MANQRSEAAEDGIDWDEWMALTDAEQEAEADRAMNDYARWYAGLSLSGQIAHCRWSALENCRSARRLIRMLSCPQIIRDNTRERLKTAQVRLLKIRVWRATGTKPGEA